MEDIDTKKLLSNEVSKLGNNKGKVQNKVSELDMKILQDYETETKLMASRRYLPLAVVLLTAGGVATIAVVSYLRYAARTR